MIIGVTSTICAGKDSVADYLMKKGFVHISFSDYLREELKKQGKEITLQGLANLGNELRKKHGPSIIAERLLEMMDSKKDYIITSFRNPEEVLSIKKNSKQFKLIALDADRKLRWMRMQGRAKKENEPKTFEEFKTFEDEQYSSDPSKMNLGICMQMADNLIVNEGSLEELHQKIDSIVNNK